MEREKNKADEYETSLAEEEKILESIQDSLKGKVASNEMYRLSFDRFQFMLDKTQVFHDQIEIKQRELQPWKAKINAKQAEIDVATSERDALAQKAEDLKKQLEEAQEAFEALKTDQQVKVSDHHLFCLQRNVTSLQISEQEALKNKKANLQRELRQAEERLKVGQLTSTPRRYLQGHRKLKNAFKNADKRRLLHAKKLTKPRHPKLIADPKTEF